MTEAYRFKTIERKWQRIWKDRGTFQVREDDRLPKYYCLEMYPYPSGRIHMGHVRNYTIVDVISRFKKMEGFNVLHPIGWDAFGMPAENAAIKEGIHPRTWTLDNIAHMKAQLQRLGFSYDWSREVNTCLPEYYKWNQWIFLKLYERGLAFRKQSQVNWCSHCQTVLANEQVHGGKCWRCENDVGLKTMEQWFLKITAYAEELLSGHQLLEKWPEHVLIMQRNWVGKSTGAQVSFPLKGSAEAIDVFTTRIDTIYGATFMVLSPEHPLSRDLVEGSEGRERVQSWIDKKASDLIHGTELADFEKEGIDTGKTAVNPFTKQEIPIWVANYVLMEYGTGAIMAVPAHDQRDFEFATKYGLPVKEVVKPRDGQPGPAEGEVFEDYGMVVDSGPFSGLASRQAVEKMAEFAQMNGFGKKQTLYRLRDWGISRQRYWGTPIPVVYCPQCGVVGIPYEDLPVTLPTDVAFKGEEGSPLATAESFLHTSCPKCRGPARRDTDTMDTFFDSSWYYFRYCSPEADDLPFGPQQAAYWLPVDIYVGGVEHAIMHLIYARFFCKVLRDLGLTAVDEPFPHYLAQGMVTKDGAAMSKSRGNVVDPDDMMKKYGADAIRLFILFASPPDREFVWDEKGIEGTYRFLQRVWRFFFEHMDLWQDQNAFRESAPADRTSPARLRVKTHQTIMKVTGDIGKRYHLNTAVSSIMELFNQMRKDRPESEADAVGRSALREAMSALLLLLAPFTPYMCEELWERLGRDGLISDAPWPDYDQSLAREETVTIVVQVNGKLRARFDIARDLPEDQVKEQALALGRIREIVGSRRPRKIIHIPNRLVNIVL